MGMVRGREWGCKRSGQGTYVYRVMGCVLMQAQV